MSEEFIVGIQLFEHYKLQILQKKAQNYQHFHHQEKEDMTASLCASSLCVCLALIKMTKVVLVRTVLIEGQYQIA